MYNYDTDIFMDKRLHFHRSFSNYSKNFGFALIVLLLLLTVVGVIISYHVVVSQQKEQELKIEKAALQIQGIVEASEFYHKVKNNWPDTKGSTDFFLYLPLGKLSANPWGGQYTFSIVDGNFWISTEVGREDVAKSIAALLPNAVVEQSKVVAKVVANASSSSAAIVVLNPLFKSLNSHDFDDNGIFVANNQVVFNCPISAVTGKMMQGELMVIPIYFNIGSRTKDAIFYPTPNIKKIGLDDVLPSCQQDAGTNTFRCSYSFHFQAQVCPMPWIWGAQCSAPYTWKRLTGPIINAKGYVLQDDGSVTLQLIPYCRSL